MSEDSTQEEIDPEKLKDVKNILLEELDDLVKLVKDSDDENLKNINFLKKVLKLSNIIHCHLNKSSILSNNNIEDNDDEDKIQTKKYEDGLYYGYLKNDERVGKGTMYYNNDDKYEGEWNYDERQGKGIMYYKNGDIYEGE